MDQEFRNNLAWWFWTSGSQGVAVKMSARTAESWRLDWTGLDWKIHFQEGSLTWLAIWCWILARGLSFLPYVPLHRTSSVSFDVAIAFPPSEWWSRRDQGRSHSFFYDWDLEVSLSHPHSVLLVTWVSSVQWGRPAQKQTH